MVLGGIVLYEGHPDALYALYVLCKLPEATIMLLVGLESLRVLFRCQISSFIVIGEYRWVQIGTLSSEEWSFSVHFGYTSGKPA
jgi:hypothetical protein